MKTNVKRDFQICISVPLISLKNREDVYQNSRSPAHRPWPLYFFTSTSGVKIRPALKNHIYFMNQRTWKADIAKMIIAVSCFSKPEYASSSEYPRVLNSPGIWICLRFWMSQGFGYTRVLNMPLVFNRPGFWIYQSSGGRQSWYTLLVFCFFFVKTCKEFM